MSEVAWIPIPRTAQISADYIAELIRAPALRNEECSGCRHLDVMQHIGQRSLDRRRFLNRLSVAGATAFAPHMAYGQSPRAGSHVQTAQAGAGTSGTSSAISMKSVDRLAGTSVSLAYAVKAGPFIFLNGHEGYDFEKGLARWKVRRAFL